MQSKTMKNGQFVKINLSGGVISPGELVNLLIPLEEAGITEVKFGSRQQLYFRINDIQLEELEYTLLNQEFAYEIGQDRYANIVSSYVSDGLFNQSSWIREGVYKDILDSFDFNPTLKVNIVDSTQSLVPYYTGNLNFITSELSNYWHLQLRFPKSTLFYTWSSLVNTDDIAILSQFLEPMMIEAMVTTANEGQQFGQKLEGMATGSGKFLFQRIGQPFSEPIFKLPYYEGFNTYQDKLWLGVYRRSETFPIAFLRDICMLCMQHRIGQLYTTPWKSIIIKDIQGSARPAWDVVLDRHRINLRHALNELNWMTEDFDPTALALKQELVHHMNWLDIRTYKLCFGIKMHPKSGIWGSVILRFIDSNENKTWFQVQHTHNFNPNSRDFVTYRQRVERAELTAVILALCEDFYQLQGRVLVQETHHYPIEATEEECGQVSVTYQCPACQTVYDPIWGDNTQDIPAGTLFEDLPGTYCCSICENEKLTFKKFIKQSTN